MLKATPDCEIARPAQVEHVISKVLQRIRTNLFNSFIINNKHMIQPLMIVIIHIYDYCNNVPLPLDIPKFSYNILTIFKWSIQNAQRDYTEGSTELERDFTQELEQII